MKLSWGFILSSLYCSASAAGRAAHVYVWDPAAKSPETQAPSVSPEAARLILAQRLGVSKFHAIKPDEAIFRQINEFGGRPAPLFGETEARNDAHALLWIEGVEDVKALVSDSKEFSEFIISNPPPALANTQLIEDIILQAESLPAKADPKQHTYNTHIRNYELLNLVQEPNAPNDYLTILRADLGVNNDAVPRLASTISQISQLAKQQGSSLTIVLMPRSLVNTKRSTNPYGAYELPAAMEGRSETSEALLTPPSSEPSAGAPNISLSDPESFPHIASENEPVLGILPACFASTKRCQKLTNNCTGHGECALSHPGEEGENGRKACYSCQCKPTVVGAKDSKKTTYWGGPACQKKDVTVPFWLFVGSTVILVFLLGTGIGMLYSVGDEELPSVIGAGVSGPVRK
jgi:hypothetical protein